MLERRPDLSAARDSVEQLREHEGSEAHRPSLSHLRLVAYSRYAAVSEQASSQVHAHSSERHSSHDEANEDDVSPHGRVDDVICRLPWSPG